MGKISVDDRERIEVVTRMQECISKKNWVLQTDDEGNLRDKNKETLYTYNLD